MPQPIAADLRWSDGAAARLARLGAARLAGPDRQTYGRIAVSLNAPTTYGGGVTQEIYFKTAINILLISNHNSLIKLLPYISCEKYIYILAL